MTWISTSGWPAPMNPVSCLLAMLLFLIPAAGIAGSALQPEPGLLEFLGRYETASGKAVDPVALFGSKANATALPAARSPRKQQQPKTETRKDVKESSHAH